MTKKAVSKRRTARRRAAPRREKRSKATRRHGGLNDSAVRRELPCLQNGDGCGVVATVVERSGKQWDIVRAAAERGTPVGGGVATRTKPPRNSSAETRSAAAFAALGHTQRLRILRKLLEAPCTYRSIMKLTRLGAGPLYHHINQLRMAGLIMPKQRDLYELTRGGRNAILMVMAFEPLMRDKRRRPLGAEAR